MKKLLLSIILSAGYADAGPLLGTINSFYSSSFCRTYQCRLISREPLSSNMTEYRYRLSSGNTIDQPVISVVRMNNSVLSIGFVIRVQDTALPENSQLTRMWADAISLATGQRISEKRISQFDSTCENANESAVTLRIGAFSTSCINTGTYEQGSARRVSFRVYR